MNDYETINDWHLTGPHAYQKSMEELGKAFRKLPAFHLHEIEDDVGRTFGLIANLFRTAPIPEEPSIWASQIVLSLEEEDLQFEKLTRQWFTIYLHGNGRHYEPAPLPRALEVIFKLCPTNGDLRVKTRAVYQAGLAMAVMSKNDICLRYYAVRALRLEQNITQHSQTPSLKTKRLLAVAHMNFAIAEATEGEWLSSLDYLRQAAELHLERRGPFSAITLKPELMSKRQDLFEVYYHMALVTCRLAEAIRPGDPCFKAYILYEDAKSARDSASEQLVPKTSNIRMRNHQLDWAAGQIPLSRALTMGKQHTSPYSYDPEDDRIDCHRKFQHIAGLCRFHRGRDHRWSTLSVYLYTWISILFAEYHKSALDIDMDRLDQVINRLAASPIHKRDYARATFLYSRCLRAAKRRYDAEDYLLRSVETYNSLRPNDQRVEWSLTWKDINSLMRYEYLDSLDVEFEYYDEDGYMNEWFESETEADEESHLEVELGGTSLRAGATVPLVILVTDGEEEPSEGSAI